MHAAIIAGAHDGLKALACATTTTETCGIFFGWCSVTAIVCFDSVTRDAAMALDA